MKIRLQKSFAAVMIFCALLFISCRSIHEGTYQDSDVYEKALYAEALRKATDYEGPLRNPIIVIHGLLGADLFDTRTGENIWGDFIPEEITKGVKFRQLALPMEKGIALDKLKSHVIPTGILETSRIEVMNIHFEMAGYEVLIKALEECGYVLEGTEEKRGRHFPSLFVYYYDWRRDISANAAKLDAFIKEKRKILVKAYEEYYNIKDHPVKFDIAGHSMGGLVTRYYLMYGNNPLPDKEEKLKKPDWSGAENVERVIIIATPNQGFADTLLELNAGLELAAGAPLIPKSVVGTFTSYYEMLPDPGGKFVVWSDNGKEVDYFNPETWKRYSWGLADPKEDEMLQKLLPSVKAPAQRREIALDHLEKVLLKARLFKKAVNQDSEYPEHLTMFLFAGDALETVRTISVDRKTGKLKVARKDAGDGKITCSSSRHDLRDGGSWAPCTVSPIPWTGVYYLQGGHMGVMKNDVFRSNLRYVLQGVPTASRKKQMFKMVEKNRRERE